MTIKSSDKSGPSLLIIEDDEDLRKLLCVGLLRHGFEARSVVSGEEGLTELDRDRPDLVLLDIFMEGMDGIDVLRAIRERFRDLPVVLLTGYGSMTTAIEALRLGASDYLFKPIRIADVAERLRIVLNQSAPRKADPPMPGHASEMAGRLEAIATCARIALGAMGDEEKTRSQLEQVLSLARYEDAVEAAGS